MRTLRKCRQVQEQGGQPFLGVSTVPRQRDCLHLPSACLSSPETSTHHRLSGGPRGCRARHKGSWAGATLADPPAAHPTPPRSGVPKDPARNGHRRQSPSAETAVITDHTDDGTPWSDKSVLCHFVPQRHRAGPAQGTARGGRTLPDPAVTPPSAQRLERFWGIRRSGRSILVPWSKPSAAWFLIPSLPTHSLGAKYITLLLISQKDTRSREKRSGGEAKGWF